MGNPTTWKGQTRTFNSNNQETTGGTSQFAYDGNGNPTTYKGASFSFNENDKLTSVGSAGNVTLAAGYRSDGLRGWKDSANGTTYFLYDGDRLLCEFDESGTLKNTNVWGANGLLARDAEVASSTRFYLWDDRGNIAQSLNENGTVATNYNVSAWGDVTSDVSSSDVYAGLGGQFGNYRDVETGLLLCGQRYYDASAGRWLNRDPIGYDGGLNLYGYCGNNAVNNIDPSGLDWLNDAANFSAGIGDNLSFGATGLVRQWMGTDDVVDPCSGLYKGGQWAGTGVSVAMGGAGVAGAIKAAKVAATGVRVAAGAGELSKGMTVVAAVEKGETVASLVNKLKGLTFATGNEHALVKLASGERVIVSGGEKGIEFGNGISRLYAHTHPYQYAATGPSGLDRLALKQLGQRSSWLIEHGQVLKFGR